jgi:hypothetical protein
MNEKLRIIGGMLLRGENQSKRRKLSPLPLCPPQIPKLFSRYFTWLFQLKQIKICYVHQYFNDAVQTGYCLPTLRHYPHTIVSSDKESALVPRGLLVLLRRAEGAGEESVNRSTVHGT